MGHSTTLLPTWRTSWARLKAVGLGAPGPPEERDVVEHAQVPARVLADHLLGASRAGPSARPWGAPGSGCPAPAQRIAQGGVLGGARGREAAHRLHHVEAHELVVARGRSASGGSTARRRGAAARPGAGSARQNAPEEPHALDLVDEPGDGHADEDGRLLDRADLPADGQPVVVGEGERDALVGEAPVPAELALGDPAVRVRDRESSRRRSRPRRRGAGS